jgi:hypothetical protein
MMNQHNRHRHPHRPPVSKIIVPRAVAVTAAAPKKTFKPRKVMNPSPSTENTTRPRDYRRGLHDP